jgi:phage tail P2-like protein
MTRLDLLPKNATGLERTLSQSIDRMEDLQPGVAALRGFKHTPPPALLPFLIWEYGLQDVALYVPDFAEVIVEGIAFQRLRGTLASIHRALNWIGRDGTVEEVSPHLVKWWWFQLHLPGQERNTSFVTDIIGLVNSAKPVRSTLARITAGYDVRGFRLNASRLNGGGLLNSWSGVQRRDGEPVLSLLNRRSTGLVGGQLAEFGLADMRHVGRLLKTQALIAVEQKSGFGATPNSRASDYDDPDTVFFNNASFSDMPFGVPSVLVQTGS